MCKNTSALYRELKELGVYPYRKGKYRRSDIINAVARRSHTVAQTAKRRGKRGEV